MVELIFKDKEESDAFWEWLRTNKNREDVMEATVLETREIFLNEYRKPYTIERIAKISYDGKQLTVRIPKDIVNELELSTEDGMLFRLTATENKKLVPQLEISIIEGYGKKR